MAGHQDYDVDDGIGEPKTEVVKVNLQDVIRERKAERRRKAEEKRQADLQRIRDMRSTTGIDPLQRFPKEIWAKIFDELNPEDRGNVWEIHPLFRDLLENTRVRDILLPQVPKVILTGFSATLWPGLYHRSRFNEQLRRISKSSRKSFDRSVEKSLTKRIQEKQCEGSPHDMDVICLNFNYTEEWGFYRRLLTTFKDEEANSAKCFFPRGLSVSLSEYDMEIREDNPVLMDRFKSDITTLLRRIGHQIWHFRFLLEDLESVTFSASEVYILFHGWISLMPNLKWLEVLIQPSSQLINPEEGNTVLGKSPFPNLAHLERLTFHSKYEEEKTGRFDNIYGVILAANQNIKILDLNYRSDKDSSDLPHIPAHLTRGLQLTKLTVCDEEWDCKNDSTYLVRIRPIINFSWKLQTIVLSLTSTHADPSVNSVLRFIENFPSLEKVRFNQLEEFTIADTDKFGYLRLPNLKEFYVEMTSPEIDYNSNIHFFLSLQFLMYCQQLRKIYWQMNGFNVSKLQEHLKKHESKNFGDMIDFGGGMKNLYYSNLWYVFPYLDTIDVEIRKRKEAYKDSCRHEYLRAEMESMTMRKFWKSHGCTRYGVPEVCVL